MINFKWFHLLVIGWLFIIFNSDLPGVIEGRFLPVITEFEITESVPNKFSTIFYGGFIKKRSCVFIDIDWYVTNEENDDSKIRVTFEEGEIIRVPGKHAFGPWKVNTPIDNIKNYSYANVRHDCHSFWTTITKVYP